MYSFELQIMTRRQHFDAFNGKEDLGHSNRTEYLLNYLVEHDEIDYYEQTVSNLKHIN